MNTIVFTNYLTSGGLKQRKITLEGVVEKRLGTTGVECRIADYQKWTLHLNSIIQVGC